MSVPDQLVCLDHGLECYTRVSDVEPVPTNYGRSVGIWLDAFFGDWYGPKEVRSFLRDGKSVCLVSSELHKREHLGLWQMLRDHRLSQEPELYLCTDLPEAANSFFSE